MRRKVNLRKLIWKAQNWLKGYKWSWVRRFRCCDHTTPYHYKTCPNRNSKDEN